VWQKTTWNAGADGCIKSSRNYCFSTAREDSNFSKSYTSIRCLTSQCVYVGDKHCMAGFANDSLGFDPDHSAHRTCRESCRTAGSAILVKFRRQSITQHGASASASPSQHCLTRTHWRWPRPAPQLPVSATARFPSRPVLTAQRPPTENYAGCRTGKRKPRRPPTLTCGINRDRTKNRYMKKNKDPKQAYKLVALHAIHPRVEFIRGWRGLSPPWAHLVRVKCLLKITKAMQLTHNVNNFGTFTLIFCGEFMNSFTFLR